MSKSIELVVKDKYGLHGSKCASIVRNASHFISNMQLSCDGHQVDLKSILGLLSLAVSEGKKVTVSANGIDANEALEAVSKLIA